MIQAILFKHQKTKDLSLFTLILSSYDIHVKKEHLFSWLPVAFKRLLQKQE